jgi:hypothetical protein
MSSNDIVNYMQDLGLIILSIVCVLQTSQVSRLNKKVLDLEYPQYKGWTHADFEAHNKVVEDQIKKMRSEATWLTGTRPDDEP